MRFTGERHKRLTAKASGVEVVSGRLDIREKKVYRQCGPGILNTGVLLAIANIIGKGDVVQDLALANSNSFAAILCVDATLHQG